MEPLFRRRQSDGSEQFQGLGFTGFAAQVLVQGDALAELVADGQDGIERRHGVLENHGHVAAAQAVHLRFRQGDDIAAVPEDLAASIFRRFSRQQLHGRLGRDGFTAARFADDADGFAGIDGQRHVVDGFQQSPVGMERNGQMAYI